MAINRDKGVKMEIYQQNIDDIHIIGITGRIDATNSKSLETAVNNLLDQNKSKIVVDLAEVEYISSVGLRVLLDALKRQRQNHGFLKLTGLQPFVLEVFEVTGFTKLFSIYPNQSEALKAFRSEGHPR
jgi:anti-sigma B factor antagonist